MSHEKTVTDLFSALADTTRQQIVEILSDGQPRSVSQISGHFGITRQAVTKHLSVLGDAGIVVSERQGRDRFNRLQPGGLNPLLDWFRQYSAFWDERLEALKRQVEKAENHEQH